MSQKEFKLSWDSPRLEIKERQITNDLGVFAKGNIKRGEILTIYGGYIMTKSQFKHLPRTLQHFPYHVSDELLFGPVHHKQVSLSECYNHSCNPNAGFRDHLTLVAMRDIRAGEQVTFDYAICMTTGILNLNCVCGSKDCRRKIKGTDWKIVKLQKKYKKYFQPYILEKIKRLYKRKNNK